MKDLAQVFKILGDANRLAIIHAIGHLSLSVTDIIQHTDLSQTLVSFHLRAIRKSGLVTTRREGPFIYYSLKSSELYDLIGELARTVGVDNDITRAAQHIKIANER